MCCNISDVIDNENASWVSCHPNCGWKDHSSTEYEHQKQTLYANIQIVSNLWSNCKDCHNLWHKITYYLTPGCLKGGNVPNKTVEKSEIFRSLWRRKKKHYDHSSFIIDNPINRPWYKCKYLMNSNAFCYRLTNIDFIFLNSIRCAQNCINYSFVLWFCSLIPFLTPSLNLYNALLYPALIITCIPRPTWVVIT